MNRKDPGKEHYISLAVYAIGIISAITLLILGLSTGNTKSTRTSLLLLESLPFTTFLLYWLVGVAFDR